MRRFKLSLITLLLLCTFTARGQVSYHGVFVEASPTANQPQGWLKEMLYRQVEGLAKHHAVSGYPYDTCLWAGKIPDNPHPRSEWAKAWWPYEQTGYLVDGLERLGLVTGDPTVLAEAKANIRYIIDHPQQNGSLGPDHIGATNWPHAVVFRALMASAIADDDKSIAPALLKHYLARPADFGAGRDVCNVEEMLWTFSQTGDDRMLALAKRTYDNVNAKKPPSGLSALEDDARIVEHGVTFNETAKLPALLYLYTGDRSLLDASINAYKKVDRDHSLASGLHTAQEKLEGHNPWDYTETCDVTDYTWSLGYLLVATGDATWADKIETAVFNAGLGAIGKDWKSHQYFSAPNQVVAIDGICKRYHPNRLSYRPLHDVECCSGNVHRFLPNYALRQWLRTPDGGVVAALYGVSRFTGKVGATDVTVEQRTEYPFSASIDFVVRVSKPTAFPFLVRVPAWTDAAKLTLNGSPLDVALRPGSFAQIDRTFNDGDVIALKLPMHVTLKQWGRDTVSIERGPVVYSLKIDERNEKVETGNSDFPSWNKRPNSHWNYALKASSADDIETVARDTNGCPWDVGNTPIELRVSAKRITNWGLARDGGNPGVSEGSSIFIGNGESDARSIWGNVFAVDGVSDGTVSGRSAASSQRSIRCCRPAPQPNLKRLNFNPHARSISRS